MLDFEFWKELAAKFRAIQSPSSMTLSLEWQQTYGAHSELKWKLFHDVTRGRTLYLEFMLLAHDAGFGSDKSSREPVRTWIEAIIQRDVANNPQNQRDPIGPESTQAGEIWHQPGRIHDLCGASVALCLELQLDLVTKQSALGRASGTDSHSEGLSIPINPIERRNRASSTIHNPAAARRMEKFIEENGLKQDEFAERTNGAVTVRTLYSFRTTGKLRKSLIEPVASAMGLTAKEFLAALPAGQSEK